MSKRLDVPLALLALATAAGAEKLYGPNDENVPGTVPPGGRVTVGVGDPGEPAIDLSPVSYNFDHQIPVDFVFLPQAGLSAEQKLDAALVAFANALAADRTLGGLVDYADTAAPPSEDVAVAGATGARGARLIVTASYSTTSPL